MKIKTKLGEIEPAEVYDGYSDRIKDHNYKWFRNDSHPGVGDDGFEYRVHYIDSDEIWVAVRMEKT